MEEPQTIWVIDTSSIIQIRRLENSKKQNIFKQMGALVRKTRLVYPKEVLGELEREADPNAPDPPFVWANEHAAEASERHPTLQDVKNVLAQVPKVLDAEKDSGAEEADPYVLAMALKLRSVGNSDVRVVTEETRDTPRKMSLRTAAGCLGLASVPLKAFLELEGIDC